MTTQQELRAAARKVRAALARRDELIAKLSSEGASLRQIVEVAEMTHAGVAKVLKRMSPPSRP